MVIQNVFFDTPEIEKEVFHDLKFPRIKIRPTGEILSVAMCKRILYLVKHDHTANDIPIKFREEWDREIDPETIEALFEMDFETTEELVPSGEHLSTANGQAIRGSEFARGTIIPAGIYYDMLNHRDRDAEDIAQYLEMRWRIELSPGLIMRAIDEWQSELPTDEDGVPIEPDDARPEHPGNRLCELPNRLSQAQDQRNDFSIPPPTYEPRPTWRGITFRHPREYTGSAGQLAPFFSPDQTPEPPVYRPSLIPSPRYEEVVTPSSSGGQRTPTLSTNLAPQQALAREVDSHNIREPQQPATAAPERKHLHWPHCPAMPMKMYTIDEIKDYLFDSFDNEEIIYPHGHFEPTRAWNSHTEVTALGRQLMNAAQLRNEAGSEGILSIRRVNTQNPTRWDHIAAHGVRIVQGLIYQLQFNIDLDDRFEYAPHFAPAANAMNLINFLRHKRGLPIVELHGVNSSTLTAAVLEAFQNQSDPAAMYVLNTAPTREWTFADLESILQRTQVQRRIQRATSSGTMHLLFPGLPPAPGTTLRSLIQPVSEWPMSRFTSHPSLFDNNPPLRRIERSPRYASAEQEIALSDHDSLFRRHECIHTRLGDCLRFFAYVAPQNADQLRAISTQLLNYRTTINQHRNASPTNLGGLQIVARTIESGLRGLEVAIFEQILTRGASNYHEFLTHYYTQFTREIDEFTNNYYCLAKGLIILKPIQPVLADSLPSNLELRTDFTMVNEAFESWARAEQFTTLFARLRPAAGVSLPPPVSLIKMRQLLHSALLDMDSCIFVPGPCRLFMLEHPTQGMFVTATRAVVASGQSGGNAMQGANAGPSQSGGNALQGANAGPSSSVEPSSIPTIVRRRPWNDRNMLDRDANRLEQAFANQQPSQQQIQQPVQQPVQQPQQPIQQESDTEMTEDSADDADSEASTEHDEYNELMDI